MIETTFDPAEIDAGFERLSQRLRVGDIGEALVEAVEPMRRDAEMALIQQAARGAYSTGATGEEGVHTVLDHDSQGQPYVTVGMRKHGRAFIAYWLEMGIPSRGIPARPWFRPTEDRHRALLPGRFAVALRKRLGYA